MRIGLEKGRRGTSLQDKLQIQVPHCKPPSFFYPNGAPVKMTRSIVGERPPSSAPEGSETKTETVSTNV